MMRTAARFDPDHGRGKFLEESDHLFAPQLPAKNWLVSKIYAVQLKDMLRRIHANSNDLVHDCLLSDVQRPHSDRPKPPGPSTPTRNFPSLVFQPSDREPDALQSIAAWVKASRVTNARAPMVLEVSQSPWPIASADGIICINM